MDFDFYNEYRYYRTADLIVIVRQPEQYQAEAVVAAQLLLKEREVSEADELLAAQHLEDKETAKVARAEAINYYKNKVVDFVEPVVMPGTEVSPWKWYRLFMSAYILIYVWTFYVFVKKEIRFLHHSGNVGDASIFFDLFNIAFLSLVLFFLVKKNRWGWILVFVDNLSVILSRFFRLYVLYKFRHVVQADTYTEVFATIYPIAIVFFFWKRPIADFFGVNEITKKRSLIVGIAIGLAFGVWVALMIYSRGGFY
jgi:hypothetical protein